MRDNHDFAILSQFHQLVRNYGLHPFDVTVSLIMDEDYRTVLQLEDGPDYGNQLGEKRFQQLYRDVGFDPKTDSVTTHEARELYDKLHALNLRKSRTRGGR